MSRSTYFWGAFAAASLTLTCAGNGGIFVGQSRETCAAVAGVVGGAAGAVIANQGEGETDERLVGISLGALTGSALGYLVCGEGGQVGTPWEARIEATPQAGEAPLSVVLDAKVTPTEEGIESYEWDLGDGSRATGPRVSHTYRSAAPFEVRLVVTDVRERTQTATARIDATDAQPEVSTAPADATRAKIILRGVNFAFDSAELSPTDEEVLAVAVEQLSTNTQARVRVVGHTDSSGDPAYNQRLSDRRARAVLEYLIARGVSRDRLEAAGRGESEPIADNATSDGRAQNRRVELNVDDQTTSLE